MALGVPVEVMVLDALGVSVPVPVCVPVAVQVTTLLPTRLDIFPPLPSDSWAEFWITVPQPLPTDTTMVRFPLLPLPKGPINQLIIFPLINVGTEGLLLTENNVGPVGMVSEMTTPPAKPPVLVYEIV